MSRCLNSVFFHPKGAAYPIYDYHDERSWRHLYKTYLTARIPRYTIGDEICSVRVSWADADERITTLLKENDRDFVVDKKNQNRTAKRLSFSYSQVSRIMRRSVSRGLDRREEDSCYLHLSIDEKSTKKEHHYLSILSDERTGMVIDVVSGRTKKSVDDLCSKLSKNINSLNDLQIDT